MLRPLMLSGCLLVQGCEATIDDHVAGFQHPERPAGVVPLVSTDVFLHHPDGRLECLSDCTYARPDPDTSYTRVQGNGNTACALREDETLECWGPRGFGAQTPDGRFRDASAERLAACGVTDLGDIVCWGEYAAEHEAAAPEGTWDRIGAVAGGFCVWNAEGVVSCFTRSGPTVQDEGFLSFTTEQRIGCGFTDPGVVGCFEGSPSYNMARHHVKQFGIGGALDCVLMMETRARREGELICSGVLADRAPSGRYEWLSVHHGRACAVDRRGDITCWGQGWHQPTVVWEAP